MPTPWYADGLSFSCTRCGKCCTGFPGFVWVEEDELQALADLRGETLEEVTALYTQVVNGDRSLRDKPNTDCIFYDAATGCTVYEARPRQCRTWPFWESTVATPTAWERTKQACPGAGQGELIPVEEITRRIKVIKL